jgi:hypothetical protein
VNGYTIAPDGRSIMCHRCGKTSYNLHDVSHRYCGHCKRFHDDAGVPIWTVGSSGTNSACENRPRELRKGPAIAAQSRHRREKTKKGALHQPGRRAENDHITELGRRKGQLQQMRHTIRVGLTDSGETENVSIIWGNRSPGVASTRTRASRLAAFHQSCHIFGSIVSVSPCRKMLVFPFFLTVNSPSRTVKRSTIVG